MRTIAIEEEDLRCVSNLALQGVFHSLAKQHTSN